MTRPPLAAFLALVLALAIVVGPTALRAATPVGADPEAKRILAEVGAAYKALAAYADQGTFVLTLTLDGQAHTQTQPASIALERPNKLRVDAGLARLISDGTTLTSLVGPSKKFASEPAPPALTFQTVSSGPVGSLLLGGPSGPLMQMVLGLLLSDDPTRGVLDLGESLKVENDRVVDGVTCRVLELEAANKAVYRILIDADTKLLRGIDVTPDAASLPFGNKVKVEALRWNPGKVATKALAPELFAAVAPKEFARLGEVAKEARGADDEPKFQVHELVDKPAPAFTMTILDGEGKTRTIDAKDLAGKVVVIDFWATWCGPCLAELPQIQKLIEGYARAKKDVVIVALSQDDDPKEVAPLRKLIEETLAAKKIVLTATPVGKVGLDPSNSVGTAFKVEGYPTVVILDGKGVVRSAHVGNRDDVGATLGREIDALLEGKPIPKTPGDAKVAK